MATIHELFHRYLRNDVQLQNIFGQDRYNKANVFYLENKKQKQPYGTIWLIEDPKVKHSLCNTKGGTARFQCDTFTKTYVKGIQYREIYEDVVKGFEDTLSSGIKVQWVKIENEVDRSDTIDGLFQFSFEALLYWEQS